MTDEEPQFVFRTNDRVFSWDGGRYVYEWFEDGWEAMEWLERQTDPLPRAVENVIENNISPYRTWDIYNGLPVAPMALEQAAFEAYVTEYIIPGKAKRYF